MKRGISFILSILFALHSFGQIEKEVNDVLSKKDFPKFKEYADKLSDRSKGISAHWECLRDLTSGFQEGVFEFEKSVPHKDNSAIADVFTFRVNLIVTDKEIIYYDLGKQENKKVKGEWIPYYVSIDLFKNDSVYNELKSQFKKTFDAPLNEKELFITSLVYGGHCGYAGVRTEEGYQIEQWVKDKDKTNLLKWLQSTNTEKQIYAVEGFFKLKQEGVAISPRELELIKAVLQKKGTIHTCHGCIHSREEISEATEEFKF